MLISSINVSDKVAEIANDRISLMIPFIEIGEDVEELATGRNSLKISFNKVGDENTVALPIDTI
jgi:hypothetical protein